MKKNSITYFIVSFLFFSVLAVGFLFKCTDAEYYYNQQIARGFISKDAVFFEFDDPSYYRGSLSWNTDMEEPSGDIGPQNPPDTTFVLNNPTHEDGVTSLEKLLASYDGNYLAAIHKGIMRGVVYKGNIALPPIKSGRFFTEDECLSDIPLAVIGMNKIESTVVRNGRTILNYNNREYEVIGMVGLSSDSPLDDLVFLNLGSLSSVEQLKGAYYIDCSIDNKAIYDSFAAGSDDLFGCGLRQRAIPKAFIDIVSGGMYMKSYMRIIMIFLCVFTFISVLIQSLRKACVKIAVLKIQGVRYKRIFFVTVRGYLISSLIGLSAGMMFNLVLICFGIFSLPIGWLIGYLAELLAVELVMLIVWLASMIIYELRMDPKGVIQKI